MSDLGKLAGSLNDLKQTISKPHQDENAEDETEREEALEAELDQIRQVNDVLEGVIESLKVTEFNLSVCSNINLYSFSFLTISRLS